MMAATVRIDAKQILPDMERLQRIALEIAAERIRQHAKWGEQNHPDGTNGEMFSGGFARADCEKAFERGEGTWRHIFLEEVFEACEQEDPEKLREELIQVAAVAAAWAEAIDRRSEPAGDDEWKTA